MKTFSIRVNMIWALLCLLSMSKSAYSQDLRQLYISEILVNNISILADEDYSDWIELYNPGPDAIDFTGWYLTNNPDNLIKRILSDFCFRKR